MKQTKINYETINDAQKDALREIHRLGNLMFTAWDEEYLFDLFCEAEDLWNEYFPFEASQAGDDWYLTKRFNDISREIRNRKNTGVTVNLFGCDVTVNIKNIQK